MKNQSAHGVGFWAGAITLIALMAQTSLKVGAEFSSGQVIGSIFGYLLIFTMLCFVSGVRLRFSKPHLGWAIISTAIGVSVAFLANWRLSLEHPFIRYYQPNSLANLDSGISFHQDTAFHSALIQSILNFGYPSTGQNGTPVTFYYVLSHYLDAFVCRLTGLPPYQSAALFFEIKKILLLLAVAVFVFLITRGKSGLLRLVTFVLFASIMVGSWSAIGSEGLWSASVLMLLAAPKLTEIVSRRTLGVREFGFVCLIIALVASAKIASGLMLAVFLGSLLLMRNFKNLLLWICAGALLIFFGVAAVLFSRSNPTTEVRGFSIADSLNFLNFTTQEQSVENLAALYVLLALIALIAVLVRKQMLWQLLAACLFGLLVLGALASHFNRSDEYYFSFGLLNVMLVVAVSVILNALDFKPKQAISWIVALALAATAFSMPQAWIHLFGPTPEQQASYRLHKFPVRATSIRVFEKGFESYLQRNSISKRDALLFVPKWMFRSRKMQLRGQTWAHGLLLYAVTGVPLWHGSPELHAGYGFGAYRPTDLWVNSDSEGIAGQCALGKTVIQVRSFSTPSFENVCRNKG